MSAAPVWTTALLPCPFCGQPPRFKVGETLISDRGAFVAMVACGCAGYSNFDRRYGATAADAERQAADAWNTRQEGES